MAQFEQWFSQDFREDIVVRHCESVMFTGDDKGAIVGVRLYNNETPYSGGGTVSGAVKRSDGGLVALPGTISGNAASVVIPAAALAYPGPIGVRIMLAQGGSTTTVLKAIYSVDDNSGAAVDPGTIIPSINDLITAINTAVASIPSDYSDLLDTLASDFSASTAYNAGDYVWYNGTLYRFTANHAAGSWTGADAVAAVIGADMSALNSTFESVYTRKNLLPVAGNSNTINGVQVTYNDGVLTATGTGTQSGGRGAHMADFVLDAGTYTFYRSPSTLQVFVQTGSSTITIIAQLNAGTESVQFTLSETTACFIGVNVLSGTSYNNNTWNIQIEKSAAFTSYSKPSEGSTIDRIAREEIVTNAVYVMPEVTTIDFNNTDNNKIRRFPSDSTNAPAVEGLLLNANPTNYTGFQIVVDRTGTMFYRQKWGNWGAWNEIAKRSNLVFVNTSVSAIDLNTIANNTIYRVPNGSSNLPNGENEGTVITCGGTSDTSMQIFISRVGEMYYRNKWATWTAWHKALTEENISNTITKTNILTAFSNIYCIGDSLTWSQVYTGATTQRQAYTTYPACIEKLTGVPTTFNATPGMTTMQWWAAYNQNIVAKTNQLAIIYLGNNQGLTDTLATDAPEGVSYEQYANTNTGCYAKIISKLKSVGAKIVLIKTYDVSATTNNVIAECGSRFGCAVVENAKLPSIYRTYPDGSGVNPIHYNDFGYSQFAVNLLSAIAHLDDTMLKRILPT